MVRFGKANEVIHGLGPRMDRPRVCEKARHLLLVTVRELGLDTGRIGDLEAGTVVALGEAGTVPGACDDALLAATGQVQHRVVALEMVGDNLVFVARLGVKQTGESDAGQEPGVAVAPGKSRIGRVEGLDLDAVEGDAALD